MDTLCQQCGFENPPGMRFCGNCGARIPLLSEAAETPGASTGKTHPEAGLPARLNRHTAIVGRKPELNIFIQALQDLVAFRRGHLLLLEAEPGLGKSRLLAEFKTHCLGFPVTVLEPEPGIHRWTASSSVLQSLLRGALQIAPDASEAEIAQRLAERSSADFGVRAAETLPFLERLLNFTAQSKTTARRIEFLEPNQLRQQTFLAVRSFLSAETQRQPILLILDDLEQVDQSSLDLLEYLLPLLGSGAFTIVASAVSFDNTRLKRFVDWLAANPSGAGSRVSLSPLPESMMRELFQNLLGDYDIPSSWESKLFEQSRGSPLYLEIGLHYLIASGRLRRKDGRWQVSSRTASLGFDLPASLPALLLTEINAFKPYLRQIVQAASVLGTVFDLKLLKNLLEGEAQTQFEKGLNLLVNEGWLQPMGNRAFYRFRHAIFCESAYASTQPEIKAHRHTQIGLALENPPAAKHSLWVEIIARHHALGSEPARAVPFLIQAGKNLMRWAEYEQARACFDEALEILQTSVPDPNQVLLACGGLGDVLLAMGDFQSARLAYERALQSIPSGAVRKNLAEVCGFYRKIGATFERQGDFQQSLSYLERANALLEDAARRLPEEHAQVLNNLGWIHFRQGNFSEAEKYLIYGLSLAQQAGRYDLTASIYNRLGGVYWQKDDLEKASNFVQKSLALREEIGDAVAVARSYNNLGLLDWKRGKWASGYQNFLRCIDLHTNLEDVEGLMDVHGNLGLLQLDRGEIADARFHFEESLQRARLIDHRYIIAMTYMYLSRLYIAIEAWSSALEYASKSMQVFQEIGAHDELIDVHTNLGWAHIGLGDLKLANQSAEEARRLLPALQASALQEIKTDEGGRALRLMGEIARLSRELDQAQQYFRACTELFTRLGNPLEQGRSIVASARLAVDRQDIPEARILINEARLIFRQLGAALDLQRLEVFSTSLEN